MSRQHTLHVMNPDHAKCNFSTKSYLSLNRTCHLWHRVELPDELKQASMQRYVAQKLHKAEPTFAKA